MDSEWADSIYTAFRDYFRRIILTGGACVTRNTLRNHVKLHYSKRICISTGITRTRCPLGHVVAARCSFFFFVSRVINKRWRTKGDGEGCYSRRIYNVCTYDRVVFALYARVHVAQRGMKESWRGSIVQFILRE